MAIEVVDHVFTTFHMRSSAGLENLDHKVKILLVTAEINWNLADVTGLSDTFANFTRGDFVTVTGQIIGVTLGNSAQSDDLFDGMQGQLKFGTDAGMSIDSGADGCFFNKSTVEMRYDHLGYGTVPCSWTYTMSEPTII